MLSHLATAGALEAGLKVRTPAPPDRFVDQGKPEAMYAAAGLDSAGIVRTVFATRGRGAKTNSLRA